MNNQDSAAMFKILEERIQAAKDLALERDRLYKERDEFRRIAVDAALVAAKDQVQASFEASEKAIVKAETAQREYNIRSNEFRLALDDQGKLMASSMASKNELATLGKTLEEKIASQMTDIRTLRDQLTGINASKVTAREAEISHREAASTGRAWVSVALSIAALVFGIVMAVAGYIAGRAP